MDLLDRIAARVPVRTGLGLTKTLRLLNPLALSRNLWQHRDLILQLSKREIVGRYRGSYLGIAWSFLTPLLMLAIFTLVFGVVLKSRWGLENEGNLDFALVLFAGLIVYNVIAECATRAPGIILNQPQYVKRIKFPLEVLPVTLLASAVTHAMASFLILLAGVWASSGILHWTVVVIPLVLLPLLMLCLGLGWFLASLGVFFRDIHQFIGLFTTAFLFLSPVFYPVSAIPEWLQPFYLLNPLTFIIESVRAALITGALPNWNYVAAWSAITLAIALLGYAWFQRTRRGFADVL